MDVRFHLLRELKEKNDVKGTEDENTLRIAATYVLLSILQDDCSIDKLELSVVTIPSIWKSHQWRVLD
jgi:hypothetical protein